LYIRPDDDPNAILPRLYLPGHDEVTLNNTFGDPVFTAQGQTHEYEFCIKRSSFETRIILVWTDYPGSVSATKALVNNLDLEATVGTNTYRGNEGMPGINGADDLNNVEMIRIPAHTEAEVDLVVTVKATSLGYISEPQPYVVLIHGYAGEGNCSVSVIPSLTPPPDPENFLDKKFLGLKVWLWIVIGAGVVVLCCCGTCTYLIYFFCKVKFFGYVAKPSTAAVARKVDVETNLQCPKKKRGGGGGVMSTMLNTP